MRDRISDVPVQHELYFPHLGAFVSCGLSQNETIFKLTAKKKDGYRLKRRGRACLLGPPRDDNRVRGAADGKGKLLS